jgi:hypothetical protein
MLSLSSTLFRLGVGGADRVTVSQMFLWCKLVHALACLAIALAARGAALTQVQAVQLASSLAIVWQPGRSMLEQRLSMARASGRQQFRLDEYDNLFKLAFWQTFAVRSMLRFMHCHAPPGAVASFARGFMKPGTVLPWLEAVAEASELAPGSAQESGEPPKGSAVSIV